MADRHQNALNAAQAALEHESRLSDAQQRLMAEVVRVTLEGLLGPDELEVACRVAGNVLRQCDAGEVLAPDPALCDEVNRLREARVAAELEPVIRRQVRAECELVYERRVEGEVRARLEAAERVPQPASVSGGPCDDVEEVDGVVVDQPTGRLAAQLEAERLRDEALAAEEARIARGEVELTASEVAVRLARGESARRRARPPDPEPFREGDLARQPADGA